MFGLDSILGGVGDIAGYFASGGDRDSAMNYLRQMRQGYEDINPTVDPQQIIGASVDPATRGAAMDVLSRLRSQYSQGGLDAIDRARLNEINQATTQTGRSLQAGAVQDAARRGMLNSGTTLAAQLQGGQNAAQMGSTQGVEAARLGEEGRRAALGSAANLAQNIRGQDYERAAAQDAIQRFNAMQRVGSQQATFGNKMSRQGGVSGALQAMYGHKIGDANRTQGFWSGLGRTAGSAANYFAGPGMGGGGGGGGLDVNQAWEGINGAGGLPLEGLGI